MWLLRATRSVLVPADIVDETRLRLAARAQGLAREGKQE